MHIYSPVLAQHDAPQTLLHTAEGAVPGLASISKTQDLRRRCIAGSDGLLRDDRLGQTVL